MMRSQYTPKFHRWIFLNLLFLEPITLPSMLSKFMGNILNWSHIHALQRQRILIDANNLYETHEINRL